MRAAIVFIAVATLMLGGCVLTERTTEADLKEWQEKLDEVKSFREQAEKALEKAQKIAEKADSEKAIEAVQEAKERLKDADKVVVAVQEQLDNVEVGSPLWVSILTGVGSVLGTVLAARGVPGAGGLLLRLTENPANRRRVAKEVMARDKWVDEV